MKVPPITKELERAGLFRETSRGGLIHVNRDARVVFDQSSGGNSPGWVAAAQQSSQQASAGQRCARDSPKAAHGSPCDSLGIDILRHTFVDTRLQEFADGRR
jgi:hypothetical protein